MSREKCDLERVDFIIRIKCTRQKRKKARESHCGLRNFFLVLIFLIQH